MARHEDSQHVDHSPRDQTTTMPADGASVSRGAALDSVAAQRARFGGIKWGAAFFGWLSANGLAVILVALLSAAGVALGLAQGVDSADEAANQVETLGIGDRADTLTADAALLGAVPELDSLAVVEVMTSIEERFGFQIDDESFSGEVFETVGNLAQFVDEHRTD